MGSSYVQQPVPFVCARAEVEGLYRSVRHQAADLALLEPEEFDVSTHRLAGSD